MRSGLAPGSLNAVEIDRYHELGVKVFAEFNSMHAGQYLKEHPDAAPIGPDGKPSPPPDGWQGVSPFHEGYRRERMNEFRRVLSAFEVDGIWLDYHHAHASLGAGGAEFAGNGLFADCTGAVHGENGDQIAG